MSQQKPKKAKGNAMAKAAKQKKKGSKGKK